MTIKTDQEFEERLALMCRLYRALHQIWKSTDSSDETQVVKWVAAGAKLLEKLTEVLGEVEEYSGSGELRLIVDQLLAERDKRNKATVV